MKLKKVARPIKTNTLRNKCDALRNFARFVKFKNCEKQPWRSVTFSKVAGFKVILFHGCFSCCLNCTNGTNRAAHHKYFITYYITVEVDMEK